MENLNAAFFFVTDKIISLQNFFIAQAMSIGRAVLLIAVLSAALNYALTGTGLKENIIKILKATVFFLIVIVAYPRIIGFVSSWTFAMARDSVYPSVRAYYDRNRDEMASLVESSREREVIQYGVRAIWKTVPGDPAGYFDSLIVEVDNAQMRYSAVPPASVLKIILLVAGSCLEYADAGEGAIPQFSRILKGLICAFFIILTGVFAVLEYVLCFLEFMLVSSVGVILFPLSIWEGSKFMSEKFIGAIVGFFVKLLFCNIAIFLLLYGFISLTYTISSQGGFTGEIGQIVFILFVCLLFLYICKSAPGLAQSLLTGTPTLSAAGAISAATGAVAAAGAVMGVANTAGSAAGAAAGGIAKTGVGAAGSLIEANAAATTVKNAGGGGFRQAQAFMGSIGGDVGDSFRAGALGLTRSLLGGQRGTNPHRWREDFLNKESEDPNRKGESQTLGEHYNKRRQEGARRGREYA